MAAGGRSPTVATGPRRRSEWAFAVGDRGRPGVG